MDAREIIDSYVDDVAARLRRRLRDDIAFELRTLLGEQVRVTAEESGRPADATLATEVVRSLGRPDEVAARYAPRGFNLIEPEHAPAFVTLAVVCIALHGALTTPALSGARASWSEWLLAWSTAALWWVGVLAVWFAAAGWIRRRFPLAPGSFDRHWTHWLVWLPVKADWRPGHQSAEQRRAALAQRQAPVLLPLGAVVTVVLAAPDWFVDRLAGTATSWAIYDEAFARWMLLPLVALAAARLLAYALATVGNRRGGRLQAVRVALWIGFVAVLWWVVLGWQIFAHPLTDLLFRTWLLVFLLVNTIQIVLWARATSMRARVPKQFAHR